MNLSCYYDFCAIMSEVPESLLGSVSPQLASLEKSVVAFAGITNRVLERWRRA